MSDLTGRRIAHYQVLDKLGQGGMGVVYRATDTRLDRTVALKILAGADVASPERKRRFIQEAKSASALHHPNIVTVFDIGTAEDVDYIAMEYIPGKTLHQCIAKRPLPIRDILKYGIEIADALAAAHAAGIVHRDLKPGNIMVDQRRSVKVLDFGLAKLLDREPRDPTDATLSMGPRTMLGTMVGTAAYMSPEQAEGRPVDARSDIFSFGAVLYEMLSGHAAFRGQTEISILAAVLNREPEALSGISETPTRELERLVLRCLRKEPENRVQSMIDVKHAFEGLLEDSNSGVRQTGLKAAAGTRRSRRMAIGAALLFVLLLGAAALVWWLRRSPTLPELVLTRTSMDAGLTAYPALSPDGKLLAYASDRSGSGNLEIWLQQVGGGDPIRLTRGEADQYDPCFSPDGTKIAYRSDQQGGGIYVIPALGGQPRLLVRQGYSPRYSPDGNWVAYFTGAAQSGTLPGTARLFAVPVSGGPPKPVHPEFTAAQYAIWTPDGKRLLFWGRMAGQRSAADLKASELEHDWWVAPLEGGPAVRTKAFEKFRAQSLKPPPGMFAIIPGAWAPDGKHVIFSATLGDTTNLFQIALSAATGEVSGAAQRLTFGTSMEVQPSATAGAAGDLTAFASISTNADIWSLPVNAKDLEVTGPIQRITDNLSDDYYPSLTADGRTLLWESARSGKGAIWTRDLRSGEEKALTEPLRPHLQPKISGDGSTVVYGIDAGSTESAQIMRVPGGAAETLCDRCGPPTSVSFDGKRVLLEWFGPPYAPILVDVPTRRRTELLKHPNYFSFAARFSPDEKWLAFHVRTTNPSARRIFVALFRDAATSSPEQWIPITDGAAMDREAYWSPDGNALYFLSDRDGFRCIWAQRLDAATKHPKGPATAVYHLHHARRSLNAVSLVPAAVGLCLSRDKLVFALAETNGNLWLAKQPH